MLINKKIGFILLFITFLFLTIQGKNLQIPPVYFSAPLISDKWNSEQSNEMQTILYNPDPIKAERLALKFELSSSHINNELVYFLSLGGENEKYRFAIQTANNVSELVLQRIFSDQIKKDCSKCSDKVFAFPLNASSSYQIHRIQFNIDNYPARSSIKIDELNFNVPVVLIEDEMRYLKPDLIVGFTANQNQNFNLPRIEISNIELVTSRENKVYSALNIKIILIFLFFSILAFSFKLKNLN